MTTPLTARTDDDAERRARELFECIDQMVHFYLIVQEDCLSTACGTLSLLEEKVIKVLGNRGPCIMRQIADDLNLALSTATGAVDRLVEKGMVLRERSDEDRRIVRVALTDDGKEVFALGREKFMNMTRGILSNLTEEEQEILLTLIKKSVGRSGSQGVVTQ